MGCGSSVSKEEQARLAATQEQLRTARSSLREKDKQFKEQTDDLLEAVRAHTQESQERVRLERELECARRQDTETLEEDRAALQAELEHQWRIRVEEAEQERQLLLNSDRELSLGQALRSEELAQQRSQVEVCEVAARRLMRDEEKRADRARDELREAHAEVQAALRERDVEAEAAAATRELFLAERRAAQRAGEHLSAEVRTRLCETEALQDSHRGLEVKAKSLQYELSKVVYTVGQRDHELKVKESELQEVRQSLTCIQEEMDQVNEHLQEQCGRVQRVEGSLRLSRGLAEKVKGLRGMLRESHDALAQLCGLLEQERTRREQCSQGLKQQRVRTELLLQLLHHFKSRTQDLSPQMLLASHRGAPPADVVFPADAGGGASSGAALGPEAAWYPPSVGPPAATLSGRRADGR